MKRLIPLLFGLVVCAICAAQTRQLTFTQRGNATREKHIEGLFADHPSLPIGSRAIVTNALTGSETEVAIVGRISASSERIIDLSPEAASAIGLDSGGEVIVSVPVDQAPDHVSLTEPDLPLIAGLYGTESAELLLPEPAPGLPEEKAVEAETSSAPPPVNTESPAPEPAPAPPPVNLTVYGYFLNPDNLELEDKPADMDYVEWLALMALKSREARKAHEGAEKNVEAPGGLPPAERQAFDAAPPPPPASAPTLSQPAGIPLKPVEPVRYSPSLPSSTPPGGIRVMPGFPDPKSGKLYLLQVGAFSSGDRARAAANRIQGAGFNARWEQSDGVNRVMAAEVPADAVYYAVKRLEALGFTEVWIRE